MSKVATIRMCKNCAHWAPLTPDKEGGAGGSCPIKHRLTSWMSVCDSFKSKIVALHVDQQITQRNGE